MAKKITKEEMTQTINIDNNVTVQKTQHCAYRDDALAWIKYAHVMYTNNNEVFEKMFGKCNGTMAGEYYKRIWRVEFEGTNFYLFAGKGFGSVYEVHNVDSEFYYDKKAGEKCLRFLDWLYKKLCANDGISINRKAAAKILNYEFGIKEFMFCKSAVPEWERIITLKKPVSAEVWEEANKRFNKFHVYVRPNIQVKLTKAKDFRP